LERPHHGLEGMGRVDRLRCIQVVLKSTSRLATGTLRGLVDTPAGLRPMAGNCHGDLVTHSNPRPRRLTISFVTDPYPRRDA
jgi:hypothetical protein